MKTKISSTSHAAAGALLRSVVRMTLSVTLASTLIVVQAAPPDFGSKKSVNTMNVNLYVGASTAPVLALDPTDPGYLTNLVAAVTQVYYAILASQPPVRIQAVADEITARQPDLVAIQEATLLRNQSPGDLAIGGHTPATNVVFDYLQILMEALSARGVHYAVASTSQEWDVEMPAFNLATGTIDDVRQTERNAILVRTDLPPGQLRATHPQSGHFTNVLQFPAIGLSIVRGWCSVDVFVRGEKFRYVCAHIEEETSPEIQFLQAVELMASLEDVHQPVILSGDFNSDPLYRTGTTTYDVFGAAGFADAWAVLNPANPEGGLTWGHDEYLADPSVPFVWRLDLVLYRGSSVVPTMSSVVDIGLDRATPPLWSSDHAAVTADFLLGQKVKPHGQSKGQSITRASKGK